MTDLPRAFMSIVHQFSQAGGYGQFDHQRQFVMKAGPHQAIISGDAIAWIRLVQAGLVSGEGGRLLLTEAGRAAAKSYQDGLVR
jgi:hypothetical protein